MKKLFCILILTASAFGNTTVTGNLKNLGTGNVTSTSGAFVRFWLRGCRGNQPRITGTGAIAPQFSGNTFYFDIAADGSGNVSGTLYSTRDAAGTGDGDIECGGSHTAVWYGMQVINGSISGPEVPIHAKSGATIDISNVTPNTVQPVATSPTGDTTYARLDGGNSPFYGPITAKNINAVRFDNLFANITAVQSDIGTTNPAHVVIPSSYTGTDCPSVQNNNVFEDYRAGGRSGTGTSSYICANNVVQYNTKTPGGTDALVRTEMTRNAVDATGAIVAHYGLTHLRDATVAGGSVDGVAGDAEINGTLSGALLGAQGGEFSSNVTSTGGSVGRLIGAIGYVTNSVGSTTAITDAVGIEGRGCQGFIAGVAPTNCYGAVFRKQSEASGENYAFRSEGLGKFVYDTGSTLGGFDCEDTSHANKPCFRIDSSNVLNIQAVSASGLALNTSDSAQRVVLDAGGFKVAVPLRPISGLIDIGTSTIPFNNLYLGNNADTKSFKFSPGGAAAARTINIIDPGATTTLGVSYNTGSSVYQSKRAVAGCTTGATAGNSCGTDITVTWGTAFADANYSVTCTGNTPTNVPSGPFVVSGSKLAGSVHINYFAITAAAASYSSIDCIAVHD